jgi:hypothetical protein
MVTCRFRNSRSHSFRSNPIANHCSNSFHSRLCRPCHIRINQRCPLGSWRCSVNLDYELVWSIQTQLPKRPPQSIPALLSYTCIFHNRLFHRSHTGTKRNCPSTIHLLKPKHNSNANECRRTSHKLCNVKHSIRCNGNSCSNSPYPILLCKTQKIKPNNQTHQTPLFLKNKINHTFFLSS